MTKKHFLYFMFGIIFWGGAIGLLAESLLFENLTSLPKLLFLYVVITILFSLMAMKALEGFPLKNHKNLFLYPILSWVGVAGWFMIEKLLGG